jgi:hypothetical protein
MRSNPSVLLKLLTGKVVLTAGIVTLGVGGVTAAAISDVSFSGAPSFEAEATTSDTESSTDSTTESTTGSTTESTTESAPASNHGQVVSEFARTTDLEGCEKGQAIADLASGKSGDDAETTAADHDPCDHEDESSEDSSTDSATDESTDDGTSDVDNHGQTVSDFAHTTELEGCEKGQAISDLASSKAEEHRQNPENENDPCDHADEVSAADDAADDAAPGQSGSAHGRSGQRGNANGHDNQGGQDD